MLSSYKIKNMHAMSPKYLHDFINLIYSMRKHHTKVEYFSFAYFIYCYLFTTGIEINS
jgi:hypothetical protein